MVFKGGFKRIRKYLYFIFFRLEYWGCAEKFLDKLKKVFK